MVGLATVCTLVVDPMGKARADAPKFDLAIDGLLRNPNERIECGIGSSKKKTQSKT